MLTAGHILDARYAIAENVVFSGNLFSSNISATIIQRSRCQDILDFALGVAMTKPGATAPRTAVRAFDRSPHPQVISGPLVSGER